jgi:hypothetical protein
MVRQSLVQLRQVVQMAWLLQQLLLKGRHHLVQQQQQMQEMQQQLQRVQNVQQQQQQQLQAVRQQMLQLLLRAVKLAHKSTQQEQLGQVQALLMTNSRQTHLLLMRLMPSLLQQQQKQESALLLLV